MNQAIVMDCLLRADSPIYYATREIGSFYETGDHLHNFALSFALGFGLVANEYYVTAKKPNYAEHLAPLTENGIYVTPATPRQVSYTFSNLKFGSEQWHEPERDTNFNIPNYGRIKEIAPGSEFGFRIIAPQALNIPRWIRMGIWMGKCEVMVQKSWSVTLRQAEYQYSDALNPLDLPQEGRLEGYDIVPMPPTSLIRNATYHGDWWVQGNEVRIPARMSYLRRYYV